MNNSVRLTFDSESDGELQQHLWPSSGLGWTTNERSAASTTLRARSVFFCECFLSRHTQRTPMFTNREWGGRCFYGHHVLNGPPHSALHVLALVNNGARISQMAIRSPQHK